MSRAKGALLAYNLLLLLLTAPSSVQAGGCTEETSRATAVRARIEREWPLRESDPVVQYIRGFGRRLAERAGVGRAASWRFEVVRDYSVNAFSIGDGLIYLTEGAILSTADESELAAILAHEMGHQLAGHFCADPTPVEKRKPWWEVLLSPTEPAPATSTRRAPNFGSLRRGIDPAKEREAERLAADILRAANYNPTARTVLTQSMAHSPGTGAASGRPTHQAKTSPPLDHGRESHPLRQPSPDLWRIQELLQKEL